MSSSVMRTSSSFSTKKRSSTLDSALGIVRIQQQRYRTVHKYTVTANTEKYTRESEPTTGKLAEDFDVAANPCYVGDSWYNTIYSLINTFSILPPLCVLRHRRLALRDIYGQSINSVQNTFPFHGRVYRQVENIWKCCVGGAHSPKDGAGYWCIHTISRMQ